MTRVRRRLAEQHGASAIEYALIAAAIAAVLALALYGIGALTRSNVEAACDGWTSAAVGTSARLPDC